MRAVTNSQGLLKTTKFTVAYVRPLKLYFGFNPRFPTTNTKSMAQQQTLPSQVDSAQPQSLPPPPPPPPFDPSRMIGIIKRKALIKELAAVYHAECLQYCQEVLELQRKWDEPFIDLKTPEDARKETMRPPKRLKKLR